MIRPAQRLLLHAILLTTVVLAGVAACGLSHNAPMPREPSQPVRIGYLAPAVADFIQPNGVPMDSPSRKAFDRALVDLGYIPGENIQIEYRHVDVGDPNAVVEAARELVALDLRVIVALGTDRVRAVKDATQTVPIVMAATVDPVETGLVPSLARPGGNITGVATLSEELAAKRLEILLDSLPEVSHVAVLSAWALDAQPNTLVWKGTVQAAERRAISLDVFVVQDEGPPSAVVASIEDAIDAAAGTGAEALLILPNALFSIRRNEIAQRALMNHLPALYSRSEFVEAGGLMSYGPTTSAEFERVAAQVDRIVKGAKPEELPVERPSLFDLVINLRTARGLGIEFPQSVFDMATRVIE
jgi:putative tryptophan/tyrosine transport system substrate-binding protein